MRSGCLGERAGTSDLRRGARGSRQSVRHPGAADEGRDREEASEDHRKELAERYLANKEICQALEDIKRDLHLEQEQAKAAKLLAIKDGRRVEELMQSLKACEGKLSTSIEDR